MGDDSLFKLYFLAACFLQLGLQIKSEVDLKIFQSVHDDITDIQSNVIEIPVRNNNYTLICKIMHKNEVPIKSNVYWLKMPHNSKLPVKILANADNSVQLKLNNLTIEDTGYYACASLEEDVLQDIYLYIKVANYASKASSAVKFDIPQQKIKRDNFKHVVTVNRTSWYDDQDYLNKNPPRTEQERKQREQLINTIKDYIETTHAQKTHEKNNTPTPISPLKTFWIPLAVPFCVVFIWMIFYCCGGMLKYHDYNNANLVSNMPRSRNVDQHSASTTSVASSPEIDRPRPSTSDRPPSYNTTVTVHGSSDTTLKILDIVGGKEASLPPTYADAVASENAARRGSASPNYGSTNN